MITVYTSVLPPAQASYNFMMFINNYDSVVLQRAFDATGMGDHFYTKWSAKCRKLTNYNGSQALKLTLEEMSYPNYIKFFDYVTQHYRWNE